MSIFDKIFRRGKSDAEPQKPVSFDKTEMLGYLKYNSTSKYQGYRFDHFNKESNPATLRAILNPLLSSVLPYISAMTCVSTSGMGKVLDVRHETDRESILDTKLFPLIFMTDENGSVTPICGQNVTIILKVDGKLPFNELVVFLRGMPGHVTGYTWCIRASIMIPFFGYDDDLRTGRRAVDTKTKQGSNYSPMMTSFIIYEDLKDISPLTHEFEKVEKESIRKANSGEGLSSMQEWAIIYGLFEHNNNESYIEGARHFMSEGKWLDAYSYLIRVYHNMTSKLSEKETDLYYQVAYMLGVCLDHLKRYDEAAYFYWLSQHLDRLGLDGLINMYANLCDVMLPESLRSETYCEVWEDSRMKYQYDSSEDYDATITVGYVLNELYGAKLGNLTSLAVLRAGESELKTFITDEHEVWNFPMRSILDADTTVIVGYSPILHLDASIDDKSQLMRESSFIMKVVPANEADGLMRVHIMMPNFPYNDDKLAASEEGNVPEGISIIMSKETMRFRGLEKDPAKVLSVSTSLADEKRFIESLHAARYAFARIIAKWDANNQNETSMLYAALYQIGFCLMDFMLHDKANYYLRQAASSYYIMYIVEYVNSLANLNNPHTLSIIDAYEQVPGDEADPVEYRHLMKFLKRRRAFYMIENGLYDDAEIILKEILNSSDEDDRDFAQSELAYIEQLRSNKN